MLNSLRSRLLASYLVLIIALLVIFIGALAATSAFSRARSLQTAIELNTVTRPVLLQLQQSVRANDNRAAIADEIKQVANDFGIRIVWVADESQRVLFDSGGQWDGTVAPAAMRPRQAARVIDSVQFFQDGSGQDWVFYTPPLADLDQTFIVLAKPEPPPLSFFGSALIRPIWRSLLIALLLSVALALLIARSVARPLQRVARAAEAVAGGNYEQTLPIEGPSEVREVANSFNEMARQVQASQQSQRDFVANVSHDLKTPITSIQGWSQALLDGTAGGELVGKSAEIIHTEASRMDRMVRELLDLTHIESGTFKLNKRSVAIGDLIARVCANFAPQSEAKGVLVHFAIEGNPSAIVDPDRLSQVLSNLLDNALTHTARDGVVRVTAEQKRESLFIRVADTGVGIDAAQLARIFERFYQADRARSHDRRGNGLGLSIAKEIVEAHGGVISAESSPGSGATFTIQLPITSD